MHVLDYGCWLLRSCRSNPLRHCIIDWKLGSIRLAIHLDCWKLSKTLVVFLQVVQTIQDGRLEQQVLVEHFKEVEIGIGQAITTQPLLAAKISGEARQLVFLGFLDVDLPVSLLFIYVAVANPDEGVPQTIDNHLHHITLALFLLRLATQVVFSGDVAENGVGLDKLRIPVDQVWKVGPFSESKVEFLLQPALPAEIRSQSSLVAPVLIVGARVFQKETNRLTQTTSFPISKNHAGLEKSFQ